MYGVTSGMAEASRAAFSANGAVRLRHDNATPSDIAAHTNACSAHAALPEAPSRRMKP